MWRWRSDKLARLQVHSDPLKESHVDASVGDVGRLTNLVEDLAATRAALEAAQAEIQRLREALTLTLAADDAGEDRAKTWEGVVRALPALLGPRLLDLT